jgi:hypothetical protein
MRLAKHLTLGQSFANRRAELMLDQSSIGKKGDTTQNTEGCESW